MIYDGTREIFSRYWNAYGGLCSLLKSPYLHLALLINIFTCHTWLHHGWWNIVLSILPNVMGFTLGGFAVFLAFGDERFREVIINKEDDKPSLYLSLCANFLHFIIIQVSAIIYALAAKGLWFHVDNMPHIFESVAYTTTYVLWAFGYFLFIYAITSALAAAVQVFRLASWYEMHKNI